MSKYRGSKGKAAFGGVIVGSPLLKGAEAQGQTDATFDGAGFNGVVKAGDTFQVAGDAQVYTIVSGGVVGAVTPNEIDVTFTPAVVPAGGWADNAAVTFASNSVAQVLEWEGEPSRPWIDGTTMGDAGETGTLDTPSWSGRVRALLDYGDAKQKAFIDEVVANTDPSGIAVTLVANDGKQFSGDLMPMRAAVAARRGAFFEIDFGFEGEGALVPNWN